MPHSWISPKIRTDKSSIGRGIFAVAAITRNEIVIDSSASGKRLTSAQIAALPDADERWDYAFQIDNDLYFVPQDKPEESDFLNHSCAPNCGIQGNLKIVALRDIAPGEEVTYDYAMSESMPLWRLDCRCGQGECRGVITGNDWRNKELQKKYRGYFSSYLEKKIRRNPVHQLCLDAYWTVRGTVQS